MCVHVKVVTEIASVSLIEQAQKTMRPEVVKRDEDLAETIEQWQYKLNRLEQHGLECKFPPVFKVSALRTMLTGQAKVYFDIWETSHDNTDVEKSSNEIIAKIMDYAREKKLDEQAMTGHAPMDVGEVGEEEWEQDEEG